MSDGSDYVFHEELSRIKRPEVKQVRREIDQMISETAGKLERESIPLSTEMHSCIIDIKLAYEQYFKELGIKQVTWPQWIFQVESVDPHDPSQIGSTTMGKIVSVKNQIIEGDDPLNNYLKARVFAHELYHATAPEKWGLFPQEINGESIYLADMERVGLDYLSGEGAGQIAAIEEGLANIAQEKMDTIIKQHFPQGYQAYKEMVEQPQIQNAMQPDWSEKLFQVRAVRDGDFQDISLGYPAPNSEKLARYLVDQVPDFVKLAEGARIKHQTVALARVITKIFDNDSYIKIMTATEENAAEVIEQLKACKTNQSI